MPGGECHHLRRRSRGRAAEHPHLPPPSPFFTPNPPCSYLQNPNLSVFFQNPAALYLQNRTFSSNYASIAVPEQLTPPDVAFPSCSSNDASVATREQPAPPPTPDELREKVERAVSKAHRDLVAAGDGVSAWKVSQSALMSLRIDSWSSLGFQLQDVPSLYHLMTVEGKLNTYIHCFVGVRMITSIYELNAAICKNEGIEQFEELGLGPLLQHPLVRHYFSVPSDETEIFKITTEEIICALAEYMDTTRSRWIQAEVFLDFLAKKRSASTWEKLGVRIQSIGWVDKIYSSSILMGFI